MHSRAVVLYTLQASRGSTAWAGSLVTNHGESESRDLLNLLLCSTVHAYPVFRTFVCIVLQVELLEHCIHLPPVDQTGPHGRTTCTNIQTIDSAVFPCFSYICFHSLLLDPSFPKVILLQKRAQNSGKLVASKKSDMTQSVVCKITVTTCNDYDCAKLRIMSMPWSLLRNNQQLVDICPVAQAAINTICNVKNQSTT